MKTDTTEAAVLRFAVQPQGPMFRTKMPVGAKILEIQPGKSGLSIWAMANADEHPETETRFFAMIPTGKVISHGKELTHLKTFITEKGAVHLFEVPANLVSVLTF